jgi:hypothetical protein
MAAVLVVLSLNDALAQVQVSPGDATPVRSDSAQAAPVEGGWFSEPWIIAAPIELASHFQSGSGSKKSGFYPELSNMNTGAGWVSAGPGYRQYLLNDRLLLDGSAALSWRLYKMVQGRIEMPTLANQRLTVGAQAMWQDQTQVNYFGAGADSAVSDRSQYRIKTTDVAAYATLRFDNPLTINGEFGWLAPPKLAEPGGTFRGDYPDTRVAFPNQPGAAKDFQPAFLRGELDIAVDTRDHKGHPTRGGLYRAALTGYRDQGQGAFSFNEYEAEAAHFLPLSDARWILAFRGWILLTDVPAGNEVPFYLQPSIGGHSTLRSFNSYRFHDDNMLVVNAESRWAFYEHLDLAAFADAGNVAPRAGDLNLAKTSYGVGLRLHTDTTTLARLDVAHGVEGWRFVFRTSDPLRLGRIARRLARVPFAP